MGKTNKVAPAGAGAAVQTPPRSPAAGTRKSGLPRSAHTRKGKKPGTFVVRTPNKRLPTPLPDASIDDEACSDNRTGNGDSAAGSKAAADGISGSGEGGDGDALKRRGTAAINAAHAKAAVDKEAAAAVAHDFPSKKAWGQKAENNSSSRSSSKPKGGNNDAASAAIPTTPKTPKILKTRPRKAKDAGKATPKKGTPQAKGKGKEKGSATPKSNARKMGRSQAAAVVCDGGGGGGGGVGRWR
eukprot:gene17306-7802_t